VTVSIETTCYERNHNLFVLLVPPPCFPITITLFSSFHVLHQQLNTLALYPSSTFYQHILPASSNHQLHSTAKSLIDLLSYKSSSLHVLASITINMCVTNGHQCSICGTKWVWLYKPCQKNGNFSTCPIVKKRGVQCLKQFGPSIQLSRCSACNGVGEYDSNVKRQVLALQDDESCCVVM
jgi:hypothetical protein